MSEAIGHVGPLIGRYFDPSREWTPALEGELRAHLRGCEGCRVVYARVAAAHRLAVSAQSEAPSGFERRRMMSAVVGAAVATGQLRGASSTRMRWLRWAATAAAVALVAVVALRIVMVSDTGSRRMDATSVGEEGGVTSRGASSDPGRENGVGLGISGVTAAGGEYEVVAHDGARQGDWLRFYYTNGRPELRYLFIVGMQPGRPLIWYAPLPPEERASLPIATGRHVKLPFENRLSARHGAGELTVLAIFSTAPLDDTRVAAALDPSMAGLASSELTAKANERLALDPRDRIEVLKLRVLAGPAEPREEDDLETP